MSYNVTAFNVREMANFRISLSDLKEFDEVDFSYYDDDVMIDGPVEMFEVRGKLDSNSTTHIHYIYYGGSFSGAWWDHFQDFLALTKGTMKAIVVWEGGDSITTISVIDGKIFTGPAEVII